MQKSGLKETLKLDLQISSVLHIFKAAVIMHLATTGFSRTSVPKTTKKAFGSGDTIQMHMLPRKSVNAHAHLNLPFPCLLRN